jgi:tRNA modification GTPase
MTKDIGNETIAAISSAVGPAARIIVRVSGGRAIEIAQGLCAELRAEPGSASRTSLQMRGFEVAIWVYVFRSPASYTGEDLVEFHLPGNPLLGQMLMVELITRGAILSEAWEFKARAYFNGQIDLTEAEGVAATIAAHSEGELRAARQLLAGELARRLRPVMDLVAETLGLIEVGIDFSEEDVTFLSAADVVDRIGRAENMLADLMRQSVRFEALAHEPRLVLVGRPNAGKSTLLNALAGQARAVVSAVAGTTRDAISAEVELARGMIRVVDVAGIEDATRSDMIEQQMRGQALREAETADLVVLVRDGITDAPIDLPRAADLHVLTKADLGQRAPGTSEMAVSALTGYGMDALRHRLDELAFGRATPSGTLALNARHLREIELAREALMRAVNLAGSGVELIALELREALDQMGRILGIVSPDDLLGKIFSTFCIGK